MNFKEYYKEPIKESPDLVYSPKGRQLVYYSGGARAFGTVHGIKDVSPFFIYALKSDLTHYDMIEDVFVTLESVFQWEWDERSKIDKDLMEEKFQNALLFNKKWKVPAEEAGRVAHEVANSRFLINKMKGEFIKDYIEGFTWRKEQGSSEIEQDLTNPVRTQLYKNSGRIFPNQRVISFWLTEDQLTPQILDEAFNKLKVPVKDRVWYAIDVVNMDELEKEETKRKKLPSYGEFKTGKSAPKKKEASEEQKKKAQELMAKQHGVQGAQKAKYKDEEELPAVGAKKYAQQMPLDVRQQVQTSESLIEEGAILDWFKDKKNRPTVKKLVNELGLMGLFATSPPIMSYYVNKFLSQNFPNLGSDIINKIAEYIAKNPDILNWFK